MSRERLDTIRRMVPGWVEADGYEEDHEKTEVVEELVAELDRLGKESSNR